MDSLVWMDLCFSPCLFLSLACLLVPFTQFYVDNEHHFCCRRDWGSCIEMESEVEAARRDHYREISMKNLDTYLYPNII